METDKKKLKPFAVLVNRKVEQVLMLYRLCDNDLYKLVHLEAALKERYRLGEGSDCPNTTDMVNDVINKFGTF